MSAHYWLFQNLLLQNLAWLINVVLINFYANIAILVQRYCLGVAFSFTLARACKKYADCAKESLGLAKICEKTYFFIIRSLNIVDNWSIFNNFVFYFAQIGRLG